MTSIPLRVFATGLAVGVNAMVGSAVGAGDETGEGDVEEAGDADGDGVSAVSSSQMGTTTRSRRKRMKPGNDTRGSLVTPTARVSTMPSSARETASEGQALRAAAA